MEQLTLPPPAFEHETFRLFAFWKRAQSVPYSRAVKLCQDPVASIMAAFFGGPDPAPIVPVINDTNLAALATQIMKRARHPGVISHSRNPGRDQ